jgi:hypothetical protein
MLENCRMMDMNKDSLVDLNEFLEAFRLCQQSVNHGIVRRSKILERSSPQPMVAAVKEIQPVAPQLDEYEISEMRETHSGGKLKKSPSIKSIVSVESLGITMNKNNDDIKANGVDDRLQNDGDIEIEDIINQIDKC